MTGNPKVSTTILTQEKNKVLLAASEELNSLAHLCKEIQWAISALLETAHHPDLNVEMHVLQDIDRMQQTLADLARLAEETAPYAPMTAVDKNKLKKTIQLESLRRRLFPEDQNPIDLGTNANDITWF